MNVWTRMALGVALCGTGISATFADEPPAKVKAKVEFRWLENKSIPGLTEEKGIQTSETDELSYPHLEPILTNVDIAEVRVSKVKLGTLGDQFTLNFELTKEARKKLADSCGPSGDKMLAAMVDGKYRGSPYYLKSRDEATFVPYAGFFQSQEQVDPIVAAFKKNADGPGK